MIGPRVRLQTKELSMSIALALILSVAASDAAPDHTGIHWVLPFPKAQQQAQQDGRLLLIKPIAFGTTKEGGW